MKKLLFAFLFAVMALTLAPVAQAYDYCRRERVIRYYDPCGYPVYGYVNRYYDNCYYGSPRYSYGYGYGGYSRHSYYRPHRAGFSFFYGR